MTKATILVVEDEVAITMLLQFTLEQAGFEVKTAESAEQALTLIQQELPTLALLDWMLPNMSGVQLTKHLRNDKRTQDLPIILLTARSEELDKEQGLNIGADDYVTKPFSPRELVARIKALLRRHSPHKTQQAISFEGLQLDPENKFLQYDLQPISIGPTEFKLLHFFMTHSDRVYSRQQLLDLVWGDHVFMEERTVDVHIRRLRQALEVCGLDKWVQTVRGSGYRFSAKE
ncbi:phosphate regulon transcriptional regulatory protein PhoB [Pasteurellaceae bacterium RH1A]|nr:phosphate regulon transcriptional regulatory protein PhoB [Pasteurellaceae bacterium RH1A]